MKVISYLGPQGTWSELAARCFLKHGEYLPFPSFREAIESLQRPDVNYCILPVENSVEGPVPAVIDLLVDFSFNITGELIIPVRHALLALSEDIDIIYSHPQAIAQCRSTLSRLYTGIPLIPVESTSLKAKEASSKTGVAIIGSSSLAGKYGLRIINRDICDYRDNLTRFIVLGKENSVPTRNDKTTVTFVLKEDNSGSLVDALKCFSTRGISLSMVMSRPEKKNPGTYRFYIDAFGHLGEPNLSEAIHELATFSSELRVRGSYPRSSWKNPDKCPDLLEG